MTMSVPIEKFGKDHWSVFAYIETLCVDGHGVPDTRRMRTDIDRHPGLTNWHPINRPDLNQKYPTRLKGMVELPNHDDWDCAEDLEEAGLIKNIGTGINPRYKLTEKGFTVASFLRKHKANGGCFASFTPKTEAGQ